MLIKQFPGSSSWCGHTPWFLRLELQSDGNCPHSKYKFTWTWFESLTIWSLDKNLIAELSLDLIQLLLLVRDATELKFDLGHCKVPFALTFFVHINDTTVSIKRLVTQTAVFSIDFSMGRQFLTWRNYRIYLDLHVGIVAETCSVSNCNRRFRRWQKGHTQLPQCQ